MKFKELFAFSFVSEIAVASGILFILIKKSSILFFEKLLVLKCNVKKSFLFKFAVNFESLERETYSSYLFLSTAELMLNKALNS